MRAAGALGSLAAAALALLLLLFWLQGSKDDARSPSSPLDSPRAAVAPELEHAPGSTGAPSQGFSTRSAESASRDALEALARPAPTCLVRVVEAGTGAALPGARLWIQREDVDRNSPEWRRALRRSNDVEPVLAGDFGREVVLDMHGEARVPRPARTLTVAAARGSLHGTAALEPRAETCVVELKPYHALAIEVVDRSGKPVPGALVVFFWGAFDPLEDSQVLAADEHGRLALAKLEDQIYEHSDEGPVRVTLAGGVPCEPELVEFTLDRMPSEPVRFVAGDLGSVVVQLTDPQGRALALEGSAQVGIDTYALEDPSLTLRAGDWPYQALDAGRALFHVGLGLPLEIMCRAEDHGPESREVAGPTLPGQELRVLIPLGERMATARGRVKGMEGVGGLRGRTTSHRTDLHAQVKDGGAFEFSFQPFKLELLTGPWELKFERKGSPALGATVVPRVDAEQGVIDFGEVVLEPLATLARAHVVGDGGAPVVGAMVEVQSASGRDVRWCDEHGLARLDGRAEELPVRVRAMHDAWLPSDWLEITAPGTEATLALRRGAALEGRVLLPRGANLYGCELELSVTHAAGGHEALEHAGALVEGGRFRFEACEPGLARLSVIYDDQPILERPGIELVAGATTQLPELDLRADLRPFTLTFELSSGEPWLGGRLEVREPDGQSSSWIVVGPSARAFLLFPRPTLDLWAAGRGARPTLFEGVRDGDRLVLPSAPSIGLHLSREIPLPAPPLALVVRGIRTKPEEVLFEPDNDLDGADFVVGADGLVRLHVPWPGEYELAWCVRHAGTGTEFDVEPAELQTVEVNDSSAATVVPVRLTFDEVARAVLAATGR